METALLLAAARKVAVAVWAVFTAIVGTPLGAAAVTGGAALFFGFLKGKAVVQSEWDAAKARAEIARLKRDADVRQEVEQTMSVRIQIADARAKQFKDQADEYERKLGAADQRCLLSDADVRGLRNIGQRKR